MDKVLIIEDNLDIRDNLEEILELADYDVFTAENGALGIDIAKTEQPNLILCDISMPIKNGYEVYETLKPFIKENTIGFIFLTASAQQKDIAKGKVSGADAYITKPFHTE